MRTPASIAGHPVHPMLVTIPIGLWLFSLVCDVVYLWGGGAPWQTVALYTAGGGIGGALLAAVPGFVDLLSLPPRARATAIVHMTVNLVVVALYAVNVWLRLSAAPLVQPIVLSLAGIGLLCLSGWLGGKLVYEFGIGMSGADRDLQTAGETDGHRTQGPRRAA